MGHSSEPSPASPGRPRAASRRDAGDDPHADYRERYDGLTRGQLAERDPALYQRLRKGGLLHLLPRGKRVFEDPLAYYREHHAGLTRGQLQKRDASLYQRLRNDGLLDRIPKRW